MKIFMSLALLTSLFSSNVFAQSYSGTEYLLNIVDTGTYTGIYDDCTMTLERNQQGILVTARQDNKVLTKLIRDEAPYRPGPASYFLSSEYDRFPGTNNYELRAFMTRAANHGQYMMVEHRRVNNRDIEKEEVIECVVNL